MGFWSSLDPTSNKFFGGRVVAGLVTGGVNEWHRVDPFGSKPGTVANRILKVGGTAGPAAVGGYLTGGVPGAIYGGVSGAALGATGKTSSTTLSGFGENFGTGLFVGKIVSLFYGGGAGNLFKGAGGAGAGGGAGSGASSVTPAGTVVSNASVPASSSTLGKLVEAGTSVALLKALQGNPALGTSNPGSTGVNVTSAGPGDPGTTPSAAPIVYPGVPGSLQTVGPAGSGDAGTFATAAAPAAMGPNWLLIGIVAIGGFFLFRKKLGFK